MVLENYVILQDGVPARLHFYDHSFQKRPITDNVSGLPATRNVLVLEVDFVNFRPVTAKLSTMAEKLAAQFAPYLEGNAYRNYDFVVTQTGEGFRRSWSVQVIPLKK
jgi:hypothetical protein